MKPVSGAGTSNALAWWPLAPTGFIGLHSTHPGSWAVLRAQGGPQGPACSFYIWA